MKKFFRKLFGIRTEKTLSDFDNLPLSKVDGSPQSDEFNPTYTFGVKPETKICEKCGSGMLKFIPEIQLGNLFLHQCSKCEWRKYL